MSSSRNGLRLLVAAGGTGGHLYPALAVARELKQRDAESEVIFAGTRRGLEGKVVPQAGYALEILNVDPLRGGSLFRKLKGLLQIGPAMFESLRLLRRVHPHVVMGVGGYVSGPLLAVAAVSGVPTLILEPNAEPGLTNRWLSPWVDAAALAWDETGRFFRGKGFVSGNPVREEITRVGSRPPGEVMHLLIFGGSQGSLALNRAMIEALPHIRSHRDLLRITHQTGEAGLAWVRTAYQEEGWTARVEAYLDAMAKEYGDCDLVVSRAGATTCAELAAAGRGAILVPLPLAGDHQRANAEAMARAGAARMVLQEGLTGESLAHAILDLLEDRAGRQRMAEAAKKLARPEAAGVIVDRLVELAHEGTREEAA